MEQRRILLVRHASVAESCAGICYGQSDVELSEAGRERSHALADSLARLPITILFHSGLVRTRFLAELLSERTGINAMTEPALRERSFGEWERQSWDAIHTAVGAAMNGLITEPATYRPPGGETTFELRDRVCDWYRRLPAEGVIVAITHGGPIASLRGTLAELPVSRWLALVPPVGTMVEIAP